MRDELAEAEKALAAHDERHEGKRFEDLQRAVDWASARLEAANYSR